MTERSSILRSVVATLNRGRAGTRQARWILFAGLLLLGLGLQAWIFDSRQSGLNQAAATALVALRQEHATNRQADAALDALQQYWRASPDSTRKGRALTLRDAVRERYPRSRDDAVDELERGAATFEAESVAEVDALAELQLQVSALSALYADRFGEALDSYLHPSWYLQPSASLVNRNQSTLRALRFNHALYLMYSGDDAAARAVLEELRDARNEQRPDADVLFALARLQYDAFDVEQDSGYFRDALELSRRSVAGDPGQPLPKLFLEYLLSVDPDAVQAEVEPAEGQGSGEGEGQRGVTTQDQGEF